MKISHLITCSIETDTLNRLLFKVCNTILPSDEIIILQDVNSSSNTTTIIQKYIREFPNSIIHVIHDLNNNYGAHKNFGIEKCNGDYIWQLDGDELPPDYLLSENIHALLTENPTIEAFAVPRINDFKGVTQEHATKWGWKLSPSPMCDNRPIVNFPDFQFRVFKKLYPRISFTRRLHEKIEGYTTFVALPSEEDYALYHDKTIEKQVETNLRYNKQFTEKENQGHSVFK